MEQVIIVDQQDNELGFIEKMEAHEKALLHRAFSVFIFNTNGEMLLQQRALTKYHSGGLWTNTCCSHPLPHELTEDAAIRRLQQEMGITTRLTKIFDFVYKSPFDNGLTEHEFDHVFIGYYEGDISPNPIEVESYEYLSIPAIKILVQSQPQMFTTWFSIAFDKVAVWYEKQQIQGSHNSII